MEVIKNMLETKQDFRLTFPVGAGFYNAYSELKAFLQISM